MKIQQCQEQGQKDQKYYHRYEMFSLNNGGGTVLFLLLVLSGCRWWNDMQGHDEQPSPKLVQYSSYLSQSFLSTLMLLLLINRFRELNFVSVLGRP